MVPDQTAPRGSKHKQMTRQMTIVVIGSLRVKNVSNDYRLKIISES